MSMGTAYFPVLDTDAHTRTCRISASGFERPRPSPQRRTADF